MTNKEFIGKCFFISGYNVYIKIIDVFEDRETGWWLYDSVEFYDDDVTMRLQYYKESPCDNFKHFDDYKRISEEEFNQQVSKIKQFI